MDNIGMMSLPPAQRNSPSRFRSGFVISRLCRSSQESNGESD